MCPTILAPRDDRHKGVCHSHGYYDRETWTDPSDVDIDHLCRSS